MNFQIKCLEQNRRSVDASTFVLARKKCCSLLSPPVLCRYRRAPVPAVAVFARAHGRSLLSQVGTLSLLTRAPSRWPAKNVAPCYHLLFCVVIAERQCPRSPYSPVRMGARCYRRSALCRCCREHLRVGPQKMLLPDRE